MTLLWVLLHTASHGLEPVLLTTANDEDGHFSTIQKTGIAT